MIRPEQYDALIELLKKFDGNRETQVVILQLFIAAYGPLTVEQGEEVRQAIRRREND